MDHSPLHRRLENQVVVVTGGTRGIGEGIIRRFVEEGARVVFSGRSRERGKAIEEELGSGVAFFAADAASPSDTQALMDFTAEHFGKLDCVVNNAGWGGEGGPIAGISVEGFDQSIALLLRGPFLGIKYALPHMQSGTIINIASVASLAGGYSTHTYTAAKFGLVGLTKSAALELAERGVRVNAICPGGTATAIFSRIYPDLPPEWIERTPEIVAPWIAAGTPLGRSGFPIDIANAALWLASSESSFVTGHALVVDGGLTVGRPWSGMLDSYDRLKERFKSAMHEAPVTRKVEPTSVQLPGEIMDGAETSTKLRLENVVAVVTGASRGIGAGIVRRFVREGARVAFSDILLEKGKALEKELGERAVFYRADSMSPSDIQSVMKFAAEQFGKLDCVVNNAGAGGEGGPIAQISVEGFDRTVALLLRGPFLGIKYAVPHMQSGGTIINIASVAGLAGGWSPHPYCAAKFGVIGLTKSAALELAERGIRVNAVCPGGIATSIFAAAVPNLPEELVECTPEIVAPWIAERYPLGRSGFPADIANAVLWLASSESSFVTGHALTVDSGITAGRPWSQQNQSYELLRERFRSAMAQTTPQSGYDSAEDA